LVSPLTAILPILAFASPLVADLLTSSTNDNNSASSAANKKLFVVFSVCYVVVFHYFSFHFCSGKNGGTGEEEMWGRLGGKDLEREWESLEGKREGKMVEEERGSRKGREPMYVREKIFFSEYFLLRISAAQIVCSLKH
jgi:hypothetical protein